MKRAKIVLYAKQLHLDVIVYWSNNYT